MKALPTRSRVRLAWLFIALLLPLLMYFLTQRPVIRYLDGHLRDTLLQWMPVHPSSQLVLIEVDQASLEALGPWPWSQATHARLLEAMAPHRPRAVVLDVPLNRPDLTSAMPTTQPADPTVPAPLAGASVPPPPSEHATTRLARAMGHMPVFLVRRDHLGEHQVKERPPLPELEAAAAGVGHARLVADSDGVVRTLYAQEGLAGQMLPYVGLLLADPTIALRQMAVTQGRAAPHTGGWLRQGPFGFAPVAQGEDYRTLSYVDVLEGRVSPATLKSKDVLVGLGRDAELGDGWVFSASAVNRSVSGVALHANAIDALRQGHTVSVVNGLPKAAWVMLPILLGLYGYLRWERHAVLGGVSLALMCCLISMLLLSQQYWLSPVAPIVGLVVGYMLWSWRRQSLVFAYFRHMLAKLDVTAPSSQAMVMAPMSAVDATEHYIQSLDEAVERLQSLQQFLRQSLRDLPVAVLTCARDGTILHSNPAARRLLQINGRRVRSLDGHSVNTRNRLPAILEALRPAGSPPLGDGHWASAHSGMQYQRAGYVFRVRCVPLGGLTHGWAVVLDDLTAENRLQAERAQWLRFLSHDLRSPQANILSRVALDERLYPDAPGRAEAARTIRREVERTLALAEGFMDLSQAEAGEVMHEEVLVEGVLSDAADQVWAYAQSQGLEVVVRVDRDAEMFVHGNASLLTRALVNLLNNAIRHSSPGGRVSVCAAASAGEVQWLIQDDGDGMESAQVRRLLGQPQPTEEAAVTKTGALLGAAEASKAAAPVRARGIGLSVVWAVVQRHSGKVDVWSTPGGGSSFLISLPQLMLEPEA